MRNEERYICKTGIKKPLRTERRYAHTGVMVFTPMCVCIYTYVCLRSHLGMTFVTPFHSLQLSSQTS